MAKELNTREYWQGYHAAQRAYHEGGANYARVVLFDKIEADQATRSYKSGFKMLLKRRERDYEHSTARLLETV